jgi:hypothetical protein
VKENQFCCFLDCSTHAYAIFENEEFNGSGLVRFYEDQLRNGDFEVEKWMLVIKENVQKCAEIGKLKLKFNLKLNY